MVHTVTSRRDLDQDFGGTYEADFVNPDFVAMAKAYGAQGFLATSPDELTTAIRSALDADAPSIVEVQLGPIAASESMVCQGALDETARGIIALKGADLNRADLNSANLARRGECGECAVI